MRRRVLPPLLLAIGLLLGLFHYALHHSYQARVTEIRELTSQRVRDLIGAELKNYVASMSTALEVLTQDEPFQLAMQRGDRDALLARAKPLLEKFHSYQIDHFYFHKPDRVNLLRVHDLAHSGDVIDRASLLEAQRTGQPSSGIEQGPTGNCTLRVVYPWRRNGQLLGYLELGTEFEAVAQRVHDLLHVDILVVVDKRLLKRDLWEHRNKKLSLQSAWDDFPSVVVIDKTLPAIPAPIAAFLRDGIPPSGSASVSTAGGGVSEVAFLPLQYASDREIGHIIALRDTTSMTRQAALFIRLTSAVCGVVGGFLVIFFYIFTGRVGRDIEQRSVMLAAANQALQAEVVERKRAEDAVRKAHDEMEVRILERTMDLAEANRTLQGEVAERRHAQQAMLESELLAASTVDALTARMAILDESGSILAVNQAWRDFASTNAGLLLNGDVGANYLEICDAAAGRPIDGPRVIGDGIRAVLSGERSEFSLEYPYHSADKESWFTVRVTRFAASEPKRVVVAHENITDRRLAEEQLRHQSLHDALTGLPNRSLFKDRLTQCLARAKRDPKYLFAVLFLDLDRFKMINDSLGHAVGDRLLVTVAERIQRCLPRVDGEAHGGHMLARMGGDEFTIILDDITDSARAAIVAAQVLQELSVPVEIFGHRVFTAVSIGIADGNAQYERVEDIVRDADAAMYHAKSAGKGRYAVFNSAMHEAAMDWLRLDSDLRHALERNEFVLHYQPIMCLESGCLLGFEALLRWAHPERGLVAPNEFIPLAEETGLIEPIGSWVITTACRQLQRWQAAYPSSPPLSMNINLSRKQLNIATLTPLIRDVLLETKLQPDTLTLEITETAIMENESSSQMLGSLKELGVNVQLDDFGTGYSSLSCLHRFPLDGIKVDRSFIQNISERRDYAAVIEAIVSLARNLGISVIAEGVETPDQVAMLQAFGCDCGQGYHFSRPIPAEAAEAFIRSGRKFALSA